MQGSSRWQNLLCFCSLQSLHYGALGSPASNSYLREAISWCSFSKCFEIPRDKGAIVAILYFCYSSNEVKAG